MKFHNDQYYFMNNDDVDLYCTDTTMLKMGTTSKHVKNSIHTTHVSNTCVGHVSDTTRLLDRSYINADNLNFNNKSLYFILYNL